MHSTSRGNFKVRRVFTPELLLATLRVTVPKENNGVVIAMDTVTLVRAILCTMLSTMLFAMLYCVNVGVVS